MKLGLRALLLLAFVAAATCAIVRPEAFGGSAQPQQAAAFAVVALHRM